MQRVEVVVMVVQNKGREWYECEKVMQGEGIQARIVLQFEGKGSYIEDYTTHVLGVASS